MNLKKAAQIGVFGILSLVFAQCDQGGGESQSSDGANDTTSGMSMDSLAQINAEDVSKEELKKVVQVAQQLRPMQMQAQQKMRGAIESSELALRRFQQIARSQSDSAMADTMDISNQEQTTYESLNDSSRRIQQEMQQDMRDVVEDAGMEWNRFRQISMALRSDQSLQQRYRQVMQEQMGGMGQQGPGGQRPQRQRPQQPQGGGQAPQQAPQSQNN